MKRIATFTLLLLPYLSVSNSAVAQVYPSTGTAWVIPGYWEAPKIPLSQKNADDVRLWETKHADAIFGSYRIPELNKKTLALGYMYVQKFDCRPREKEAWLDRQATQHKYNIEDHYLHFAEDTQLQANTVSSGLAYLLKGKIFHLVLNKKGNYQTARLPLSLDVGDEIIILSSYPFHSFELGSAHTPTVTYPKVGKNNHIDGWQSTFVKWDATVGFTPAATKQAHLVKLPHVTSLIAKDNTLSLDTGQTELKMGLRVWALKLTWAQSDTLQKIHLQPYLIQKNDIVTILGWDPKNDLDNNGYISAKEWAIRPNKRANARFIQQSRLIPVGHHWPGGCWYRTNLTHPKVYRRLGHWYHWDWQRQGFSGAYNDDMIKLLGSNQFTPVSGGKILEMPAYTAGTQEATIAYGENMALFFKAFKKQHPTYQLAANISELNLWKQKAWPPVLRQVIDIWLREHYIYPSIGLQRLQKYWDNFALAKSGDKSLIMHTTKHGQSIHQVHNQKVWESDIETGLALYYLLNIPQQTWYQSWNHTWRYGSNNTTPHNWYQAGVPKNMAYQPTEMLKINIGRPTLPPPNKKIVHWIRNNDEIPSSSHLLNNIPIIPAQWFWLEGAPLFRMTPKEGVIARQYTQGLVVYRGHKNMKNNEFFQAEAIEIKLPESYQRVNYDGTLRPASNTLILKGYEGAILKKAI